MAKAALHKSIWEAQLAVMQEVSYVQKKGRVGEGRYGYSFAGESDLIAQLRPAMVKHGIVMYPSACELLGTEEYQTRSGNRNSLILSKRTFVFAHASTGTQCEVVVFGEASDTDVCFATVKVVVDLLAPVDSESQLVDLGGKIRNLEATEGTLEVLRTLYKARLNMIKESKNGEGIIDGAED